MHRIVALHSWINSLPPNVRAAVIQYMRPVHYADGEAVYALGERGHELYLIETGKVRICNYSLAGREIQLGEVRAGDCFGEMSLIDGLPRAVNAYAVGDTKLLVLRQQDFEILNAKYHEIALQINQLFCHRLRVAYTSIEDASVLSLKDRLARLLSRLGYSIGIPADNGMTVVEGIPHESLAHMLGSTRQGVSRELKLLEQAGLIQCKYGKILIPDITALVEAYDSLIGGESVVPDYDK